MGNYRPCESSGNNYLQQCRGGWSSVQHQPRGRLPELWSALPVCSGVCHACLCCSWPGCGRNCCRGSNRSEHHFRCVQVCARRGGGSVCLQGVSGESCMLCH